LALEGGESDQARLPEGETDCHSTQGCTHLREPGEAVAHAQQVTHVVLGLAHHAARGAGLGAAVEVAPQRQQLLQAVFGPDRAHALRERDIAA